MYSAFFGTTRKERKEVPDEWAYVGRFMWGFGKVESIVNELLRQLFGLRGLLYSLLLANLDLRRKIDLMKIGFKHQGIGELSDIVRGVHKLHDIRNAVAHGSFYYEPVYEGIIFDDFVSKAGEPRLPGKPKSEPEYIDDHLVFTFIEFDRFDEEAAKLYDTLTALDGSITAITDFPDTLRAEISEVLGSGNVIPFPKRPPPVSEPPE